MIVGGNSGDGFLQAVAAGIVGKKTIAPGTIECPDPVQIIVGEILVFARIKFIVDCSGIAARIVVVGVIL